MAHDVGARESREEDVVELGEHSRHELKAARAGWQVYLSDVTRDNDFRTKAESSEKHLHLLWTRVLRFVENDERVVERSTTHVGERRDLDRASSEQLRHELWIHHLVERVIQWPEVWVDLVVEGARQKSEPLPRLDGRAGENYALDIFALKRLHCLGHREVRLACARWPDTEGDRVLVDCVDVGLLAECLRANALAAAGQNRLAEKLGRAAAVLLEDARGLGDIRVAQL